MQTSSNRQCNGLTLFPPALSDWEAVVQTVLKLVSYAVLVLMASAVVYAGVIGITYWTGIGV